MCQSFGDLFLFELIWQYSSDLKVTSVSVFETDVRFKVIATYLYYMFCD